MPSKNLPFSLGQSQLFLLDSEGILFCSRTNRLFYLNTTATFLWCCFEGGLTPSAAATALSKQFGIALHLAQKDLEATLADWRSQGLLEASLPQAENRDTIAPVSLVSHQTLQNSSAESARRHRGNGPIAPLNPPIREQTEATRPADALVARSGGAEHHYCVGNLRLQVRFSSSTAASIVHPMLAHLLEGQTQDTGVTTASIEISETGKAFALYRNGVKRTEGIRTLELAAVVQREILLTAFELSGCLVAIHAAAVTNGNRCLLMPALPGSGKTSLTAALISSGYNYLTDELVLLMPASHRIRPIPVSLGLKRGSWPVLKSRFPNLETLPVFRQPDGTEVRYLSPQKDWLSSSKEHSVSRIVFPRYEPNGPTGAKRLSSAETLVRLAEAGYAVPGKLELPVVEELIAWITAMDCYELRVRDLTRATSDVAELLG